MGQEQESKERGCPCSTPAALGMSRRDVPVRLTLPALRSRRKDGCRVFLSWRPEGNKRTPPTFVIEGLDELVQALQVA
jgi:hypothetical protein